MLCFGSGFLVEVGLNFTFLHKHEPNQKVTHISKEWHAIFKGLYAAPIEFSTQPQGSVWSHHVFVQPERFWCLNFPTKRSSEHYVSP